MQLQEATNRIVKSGVNKIIVTTNSNLVPAQRNYESVGFVVCNRRKNETKSDFAGDYIDYEYNLQLLCELPAAHQASQQSQKHTV